MPGLLRDAGAIVVLLGLLFVSACGRASGDTRWVFEEKSNVGEVSFHLLPRGVEDGQLLVDVRADTHSGDLADLDLRSTATLRVNGKSYQPVADVQLAGHHARGTLRFALRETPAEFAIVITGVRSMPDLTFQWP